MFKIEETLADGKRVKAAFLVALAALAVFSSIPFGAYAANDTEVLIVTAILAFADDPTCVAVNEQTNLVCGYEKRACDNQRRKQHCAE
jgi:hypothetical protein